MALCPQPPTAAAKTLVLAGLLGTSAIALGAFGAHALRGRLASMAPTWQTAAHYHALHALALLGLAALQLQLADSRALAWASVCFCVGTVLFSGSLYGLALGGPRLLGPVTPLGGLFLLAGWACVAAAGWTRLP